MLNQYPLWKNLLIGLVALIGALYALPNLFGQDPAMQVTGSLDRQVETQLVGDIKAALAEAGIPLKDAELAHGKLLLRFNSTDDQLKATDVVEAQLPEGFTQAKNLVADLPAWLVGIGGQQVNLGLDLRGGVHVLIDVDMEAAAHDTLVRYAGDIERHLRDNRETVRFLTTEVTEQNGIRVLFREEKYLEPAEALIKEEFRSLVVDVAETDDGTYALQVTLTEAELRKQQQFALQQNISTLRNRVDALGVAEPLIQQQGDRRIVVELPGVQDPTKIKDILQATATLEYRLSDTENDAFVAESSGKVPPGSLLYKERGTGRPVLLKRRVIVTGDQITSASQGYDQRSGEPAVFVTLNDQGAHRMRQVTTDNVGKPMAVVFIENRIVGRDAEGTPIRKRVQEVISEATIREPFGRTFQTTGSFSVEEAEQLSLLLRAGALAAPIQIVEERTIGPSLGQDNIDQGMNSVIVGLLLVMAFMAIYYRVFGLIANVALIVNLTLIIGLLSMLQATLTLPGIAGIVLTVGMAVDANVLIFERIREEIRVGGTPQASIHRGFEQAFSTILDANITTLIAAIVLLSIGSGPVRGFAVILAIGIITSMFTALLGTRALVNWVYGHRRVEKLSIGQSALADATAIHQQSRFDLIGKRKIAVAFSTILMVIAIGAIAMRGLNLGIDFTGGTLVEVGYEQGVELTQVREDLTKGGFGDATVQHFGTAKDVLIRLSPRDDIKNEELSDKVLKSLQTHNDQVELRRVEFVGPQVGDELSEDGALAVLVALIAILIYVALRFEWRFASGSVIALAHDVVFTVGVFALLYLEFGLPVLAAVLAVIGYSLNDTIVVFDRIRENFRKMRKGTPEMIINSSLNQTLSRTIVTSLTTLLVLIALFVMGGEAISGFSLALIIGVVIGTYSSIYVASTSALMLGISKEDLMEVKKEGEAVDDRP